ncbi:MAG: hypothetical protein LBB36_06350 [Fibromonadaceae bacterium]|jgi:beta-galactosidase/beta-glucuronidase|nr:hypothetical protein [Fibromonadaceae bacterium]
MNEIDLNGTWKIIWDTENKGVANRWFTEVPGKAKNVEVPHLWNEEEATTAF